MKFEKDIIYIDSRENTRIERFKSFLKSKQKENTSLTDENYFKVTGSNKKLYVKEVVVKSLPIGDFMKDGIFFEFKRDDDLVESIRNGRLDKQIDNYHVNYNSYEFHVISDNKSNITFNDTNYFSSQRDILFDQFDNETECFKYMLNCWVNQQKTSRLQTLNKCYSNNGFLQIGAMCVGHNLLTSISKYYPYNKATDWLNLSEDDLKEVPGIGPTKAKQILRKIKVYV